jgi:hypothetical protein
VYHYAVHVKKKKSTTASAITFSCPPGNRSASFSGSEFYNRCSQQQQELEKTERDKTERNKAERNKAAREKKT